MSSWDGGALKSIGGLVESAGGFSGLYTLFARLLGRLEFGSATNSQCCVVEQRVVTGNIRNCEGTRMLNILTSLWELHDL